MTDITWQPVTVALADLTPWERNPKRISKTHAKRLLELWKEIGQFQTIAIGPNGEVYDGHQRLSVLKAAHGKSYEVIALQSSQALTEKQREKLTIEAHTGTTGQFDWDALAGWDAAELQAWGFDAELLQDWNTGAAALATMLEAEQPAPADDPGAQIDKAAELREKWGVETGQLWQLGEHRLICGDARTAGLVGDFAIFDPPWDWSASQYDEAMGWVNWKKACSMGLSEMFPLSSRADYRCFWFWDQLTGVNISNQSPYLPQRSCVVLFDFGDPRRFYAKEALRVLHKIGVSENHGQSAPQYVPIVRRYQDGKEAMHSDVKPAALCDYIITLYSVRGEIVVDPFAGSGSFLLSSHRLGRQWQGSEIDPANCAVILERFYDATGIIPLSSDAVQPATAV